MLVEAGDTIPADGEVIDGVASVDESAITGESAPVIRESGGDFSSVTGGTRVLSDWIIVKITAQPGEAFLDRMIAMVEGAKRGKTPNEVALTILLVALTIIFLLVCVTLLPFSQFSVLLNASGTAVSLTVLIALLVCLIPTTIGALLSAIGIAGMSRMMRANVLATSGRAIEAAGDVDVLLLDKTGTITLGNREAVQFRPAPGVDERALAEAAQLSSLADETPEGRSIVALAKQRFSLDVAATAGSITVPFSARTRMSGLDIGERQVRKGAASAIRAHVDALGGVFPQAVETAVNDIARRGGTPLVVADGARVLGAIELKDIVKHGIAARFAELRKVGVKTVMITGDNRLTAAAIAAEAGVDDYLAEATPEDKLRLIREPGEGPSRRDDGRRHQRRARARAGRRGRRDAQRHAGGEGGGQHGRPRQQPDQADAGGRGRQADDHDARRADHVQRRQRSREVFRDHPGRVRRDVSGARRAERDGAAQPDVGDPVGRDLQCADHRGVDPLALKGVKYRAEPAEKLLGRNLLIYGVGGIIAPFIGIKLIDMLLTPFI